MKKIILALAILASAIFANAQTRLFDFESNEGRIEAGFNIGQVGSFTKYADIGFGINVLFYGVYLDVMRQEPAHKYNDTISDTKWDDHSVFSINLGYQIPILKWLRVMPLLGYTQTNEGVTDGSSLHIDSSGDNSVIWYHRYDVTPGSRIHYFTYGGGLSIQPCRWFSVNLVGTSRGLYGGVGINLLSF